MMNNNESQIQQRKLAQKQYEERKAEVQAFRDFIKEQQKQIAELNQQHAEKLEQSESQQISIKNYKSILKIYNFCINMTEKIDVSEDQIDPSEDG